MTAVTLREAHPAPIHHDDDIHAWALRQKEALYDGRLADLDLAHLAEEIEALGNSQYRALQSALTRLLQHLLKWDFQPERRARSWSLTISIQRIHASQDLEQSPSLGARRGEILDKAYALGRVAMLRETGLPKSSIAATSPYSLDDVMARPVDWPEP